MKENNSKSSRIIVYGLSVKLEQGSRMPPSRFDEMNENAAK
jgi:hypothetical protein